jgi:signal transduction histidine kinase
LPSADSLREKEDAAVETSTVENTARLGSAGGGTAGGGKPRIPSGERAADGVVLARPERVRRPPGGEASTADNRAFRDVEAFAASTAHTFNNVLTGILGNLQLLERRSKNDRPARQLIRAALAAARRGNDCTMLLNAFAYRHEPVPQPCDIGGVLAGMDKALRRTVGKKIKIDYAPAGDLPRVEVDPDQFQAAILNLANNARDAMPDGGTMTVQTGLFVGDHAMAAPPLPFDEGFFVSVGVADTGCGIPAGDLEQIAEPFFTTKPAGRHAGLGLCMVREFVERSGGYLVVNSEESHGSIFRIYLPILHG